MNMNRFLLAASVLALSVGTLGTTGCAVEQGDDSPSEAEAKEEASPQEGEASSQDAVKACTKTLPGFTRLTEGSFAYLIRKPSINCQGNPKKPYEVIYYRQSNGCLTVKLNSSCQANLNFPRG